MKMYHAGAIALGAVAAHPDRPATALVHDTADARVLMFRIEPGQEVAVHTSPSTVLLTVISGAGFATGAEGEHAIATGDIIAYDIHEPHGMRAVDEQLIIAAIISPRPGAR